MHHLASSTTYAVRLLPDRVDALENRSYHIEKADIFLHAVLWGTAPISWRTAELLPENLVPSTPCPALYGLLAQSHEWKNPHSTPKDNVTEKLLESDKSYVSHPRECLDLLCVADIDAWV